MSNEYFKSNIKFLRDKMKMTQTAFAGMIGASRAQVASYEAGESRPKREVEESLLRKFKIGREQLYNGRLTDRTIKQLPPKPEPIPASLEKRVTKLEHELKLIIKLLRVTGKK